ncbi:hypothetical protein O3G_MSEX004873 [Manduca sexta]|uniref:GH18 domain-containing protein n=2 Tax=Manduca sexta TaxID=7130 RepID=A0A922CHQ0_MANSE|nr:hypothetical protein O3G_MSEX004873 [Manduca sexta]
MVNTILLLSVALMAPILDARTLTGPTHNKVVVCYVATWANYRNATVKYEMKDFNPDLCTHLVYAFAALDPTNHTIKPHDAWLDLESPGLKGYKTAVDMKRDYPHLKVTIAIGGWNEGSEKYSNMSSSPESRKRFIDSVVAFIDHYKFDGLDLDWEFPSKRGGRPEDKANFVALVKELKDAFESKQYLLTAALGAGKDTMDTAYDVAKLSRYLDLIHMMCYDYHGTWDGVVGANAPLRGTSEDDVLSLEYTIKYMISHGVSPYKLVLGLPMYGRNFLLKDPDTTEIVFGKTPAQPEGFKGNYIQETGFMGYNEICMDLMNNTAWKKFWDEKSATPYLRDGDRVVVYDNQRSIALKVKMAVDYGLGGVMVWSIDTDDTKGVCAEELDALTDIYARFNKMLVDPLVTKAVKSLGSGNKNHNYKGQYYLIHNDKLELRLLTRGNTNYPLMEAINQAMVISLEEKRIMAEVERITNTNVIDKKDKRGDKPGAASILSSSAVTLLFCLFFIGKL